MQAMPLVDRVWNAIPVTQPAFMKLLGLLDIEVSDAVETAAVTHGLRSRLLLNSGFVARVCTTHERLGMLVMHELMHVLLGHTRLFARITPAQNWAFDAVINAHLCRQHPEPQWTALFRGCYRPDRFPEAMLRPPEGWSSGRARWALSGEAGRVHRALYDDVSVTYGQLFGLLTDLGGMAGKEGEDGGMPFPLLGNHDAQQTAIDPDLVREVRSIVARWPMDRPRSGRDQGGSLDLMKIPPENPRARIVAVIRRSLWPLLESIAAGSVPRHGHVPRVAQVAYRTGRDRRATVREALGVEALIHDTCINAPGLTMHGRAHVYLDVSGSMLDVLPLLLSALRPLRSWLHPRLHLFSTEVHSVGLDVLRAGEVCSTWGTEIACVTEHMISERVPRAVIVTDGWVGDVPEGDARVLRRRGARVHGVLPDRGESGFLAPLRGRAYRLPAVQ